MVPTRWSGLLAPLALWACGPDGVPASNPPLTVPAFLAAEIETGADGTCHGTDQTPATYETVTAHILDRAEERAPDGTILSPAAWRTETRTEIVEDRRDIRFETLCPPAYTGDFVASLQRALAVRGHYEGPVTGVLDLATGEAVRDFQRPTGPDSRLLSIAAARRLGLVELSEDQLDMLN